MINIEELARFCKENGFVYQNSEIYGSAAGFWDFGPLGVELKNNIKSNWWKTFVHSREDVVGIDGSIITDKKVWEASGHTTSFVDAILECKKCKTKVRADILLEEKLKRDVTGLTLDEINYLISEHKVKCPKCNGDFEKAKEFNLMFKTNIGPVEGNIAYLRPETAQIIFTNFKLVQENSRLKLPFGIAQIGKAFRNEISPRDFLFRCREFEQMEMEFFARNDKINDCPLLDKFLDFKLNLVFADGKELREISVKDFINANITSKWHIYWIVQAYKWFLDLGIKQENLRVRQHKKNELAHYATACFDIEYRFPFGWKEIHGSADRTQYDLKQHIKYSKKNLSVYDEELKTKIIPYVVAEPSQGVERAFLAFLFDAYNYDKKRNNVVLKLHPALAPIKVAVFPLLSNKPKLLEEAKKVFEMLKTNFNCFFDISGSIGRRYARQDETGTPYCITIDFDTLKDKEVTIRNRDDVKQIRVKIKDLKEILCKLLNQEIKFEKAGKLV